MEECLVNSLVKAVDEGKRAENGFKKEAWTAVHRTFGKKFSTFTFNLPAIESKDTDDKQNV
jgi:hypothetical protein